MIWLIIFAGIFIINKMCIIDSPKVVKQGASKEEAEDVKAKLEAEGAKVTLK